MVISGRRGRRILRRPRRPLIASTPTDEETNLVHPTRSLRDEEEQVVDAAPEVVPKVGREQAIDDVQDDRNEVENCIVPPTKKCRRGPAKGTIFERLRKMGKIPLNIKDGHRGPSSENATLFSSRVSWITRVHADSRYASWSVVADKEKHELINRVRADFVLDWDRENHRKAVLNTLADRYNAYHYELHKHYKKFRSHEEALAGRKSSVEPHVWEWLCQMWSSWKFKEQSSRNTNNRKKQKVRHIGGRKSFVRLMEERGEEARNMITFYKDTHWSNKKGKLINAESEHVYNLMLERLNEREIEDDVDDAATDAFKEVLGFKSGYATGLGHSVIPDPSPFMLRNKAYKCMAEENKRNKENSDFYKSKLEALLGDMVDLKKYISDHDKEIQDMRSLLGSSKESPQETQGESQQKTQGDA